MPIMTKQYISRNGQIEYGIDEAGEILTYGRDALGNVVAGYDKNTNAVFTIDYKPFGEFAATTGTITGRRFLWVGTWGYRFTSGVPVSHYIRARHLSMRMGMWTSVDPLWPGESAYGYVDARTVTTVDPSGLLRRLPWMPCRDKSIKIGPVIQKFKCFGLVEPCHCIPIPGGQHGQVYPPGSRNVFDIYWYGNYCGSSNVVPRECQNDPEKQPVDCVDAACKDHDNCLQGCIDRGKTSYFSVCQSACHCMLAAPANTCIVAGGCGQFTLYTVMPDPTRQWMKTKQCIEGAYTIAATFTPICIAALGINLFKEMSHPVAARLSLRE